MSLEDLKLRYPDDARNRRHFIVTEVTRMASTPEVCVAAIDLKRLTIVRPLQWNHRNWPRELSDHGLQPGRIIRQRIRTIQDHHGFPHQTEDTQLTDPFDMLELVAEPALFSALAPAVDRSVDAIFAGNIQEDRYVIDGTQCRSLGSVLVDASTAQVQLNAYGKIRLSFRDHTGHAYDLPVTDLRIIGDGPRFSHTGARLAKARAKGDAILLRVGLARGFDNHGAYDPKRCYLQVNGVIFAE